MTSRLADAGPARPVLDHTFVTLPKPTRRLREISTRPLHRTTGTRSRSASVSSGAPNGPERAGHRQASTPIGVGVAIDDRGVRLARANRRGPDRRLRGAQAVGTSLGLHGDVRRGRPGVPLPPWGAIALPAVEDERAKRAAIPRIASLGAHRGTILAPSSRTQSAWRAPCVLRVDTTASSARAGRRRSTPMLDDRPSEPTAEV